jgi:hypothetical protein
MWGFGAFLLSSNLSSALIPAQRDRCQLSAVSFQPSSEVSPTVFTAYCLLLTAYFLFAVF